MNEFKNMSNNSFSLINCKKESLFKIVLFLKEMGDENLIRLPASLKFLKWKYQYDKKLKSLYRMRMIKLGKALAGIHGYMPLKLYTRLGPLDSVWGVDILIKNKYRQFPLLLSSVYLTERVMRHKYNIFNILTFVRTKEMFESFLAMGFLRVNFYSLELRGLSNNLFQYASSADIKQINYFDTRFNTFFRKISGDFDFIPERKSPYLNWRYFQHPFYRYKVFAAFEKNEVRGYIVIRIEQDIKEAYILDLLAVSQKPRIAYFLLLEALNYFKKMKIKKVKAGFSNKDHLKIFKKMGFSVLNNEYCVFLCEDKALRDYFQKHTKWHIAMGDGDFRGFK